MISKSWKAYPLKRLVELSGERADRRPEELRYVGLENIQSKTGRLIEEAGDQDLELSDGISTVNLFRTGQILFGKLRPYLAKAWVSTFDGACTTEALVLHPGPAVYPQFLLRILLSDDFIRQVDETTFGSKMPRADWQSIGNITIIVPSIEKQISISRFLEGELQSIESLLSAKQRLLETLAEKRRALITHAVTQGLDPNAPMRDSGIPWLGKIPAHWDLWMIKHFAFVGNGSTPLRENKDYWESGDIPWLNSASTNDIYITSASQFVTEKAVRECHLPLVEPESVLVAITGQGKTRGQAALLRFAATINQHMAYITPQQEIVQSEFLLYSMISQYSHMRALSDEAGGTKGALSCELVSGLIVPVPPISEQMQIINNVKKRNDGIQDLISITEKTLTLLKERRSALISAVVTGQLEV